MRTKLKARYVLGYDGQDHVLLPDAEVVYEDDSILFVGRDFPGDCDQVVDHGESLISPGFIDLDALGDIAYGLLEWELPARYASSIIWRRTEAIPSSSAPGSTNADFSFAMNFR